MIGIYKITSPTGKIYVGQSRNIKLRFNQYLKLQNCKGQTRLFRSFNKYNVQNHIFEIIEECEIEQLNIKERYYQEYYDCINKNGLNCKLTHTDEKPIIYSLETRNKISKSNLGKKHSEESKLKISISKSGINHHMYGKFLSEEIRNKISKSHIGIKPNEETKLKMSNSAKSRKKRIFSEEHKQRISQALKDKKLSEEHRLSLCKKVIDTSTNIIYNSIGEAANNFKINKSTLTQYLCGKRTNKTTLKYF